MRLSGASSAAGGFLKQFRSVRRRGWFARLTGIAIAIGASVVLMGVTGVDVVAALQALWRGSFGETAGVGAMIVKATPVVFTGVGALIALRAGVFNVGGEGQLYLGALVGTVVALNVDASAPVNLIAAMGGGFVGGALWGFIPGILKAYRGVNEIITTILMNFIGIQLVSYFVSGPVQESGAIYPQTERVPHTLPKLLPGTSASYGFLIGVLVTLGAAFVLARTSLGLQLRAVGGNVVASRYVGIRDRRVVITSMIVAGGLAGMGGAVEVIGFQGRLFHGFSPGYGLEGLLAAILASAAPLGTLLFAILLGGLRAGGEEMQRITGVPVDFVFIVQGFIILILVASASRGTSPSGRSIVGQLLRRSRPARVEMVSGDTDA